MSNLFGRAFRITTWGESHGGGVGVVIDGCPPRLPVTREEVQLELDRRRPGQSHVTTPRQETDTVEILSGIFEGRTLGTPISMMVWNKDARSEAYEHLKNVYRPSHADFTYEKKYGIRNWMGGGRASARETVGRVAAGAVARKLMQVECGTEILAWVAQIHTLDASIDAGKVTRESIEATLVRCPDPEVAARMIGKIEQVKADGDSVGGVIEVVARGMPVGLGAPVFGKLEADLACGLMSIPAVKGVEIGSGFGGTRLTGSEHNDPFEVREGRTRTRTNRSGGVQGGISNGEDLLLRVAFKPTATVSKTQDTVDERGQPVKLEAQGRHDPCVLPRAVPIVEAMVALVLADHLLLHRGQCGHGHVGPP
ncbi:MAG: chorismate synthase [Armatimonadetes bacterium]|nr:chorismate synthase [Armatimonadota bacterium]